MTDLFFDVDTIGPWVCARIGKRYIPGTMSAIGRVRDGRIVGGVLFEDYNGVNVFMHVAGIGNWLSRHMLSVTFDYVFNQLNCLRVTGVVSASNDAARRFDEKLGFVKEAILRDAAPDGDLIIYCMRREDCRWLDRLPYKVAQHAEV